MDHQLKMDNQFKIISSLELVTQANGGIDRRAIEETAS